MSPALALRTCCDPTCMAAVVATRFDERQIAAQARALDALADETRLKMVRLLARHDALCVCELEAGFDLSQPTISHHLRILREAGLVEVKRRATWAYYALNRGALKDVVGEMLALL